MAPKTAYKIKSQLQGAFAFKSTDDLRQKDKKMKFFERDLKLQLELNRYKEKLRQNSKHLNMLSVALRHKIIRSAMEMRQANQKKIGEEAKELQFDPTRVDKLIKEYTTQD